MKKYELGDIFTLNEKFKLDKNDKKINLLKSDLSFNIVTNNYNKENKYINSYLNWYGDSDYLKSIRNTFNIKDNTTVIQTLSNTCGLNILLKSLDNYSNVYTDNPTWSNYEKIVYSVHKKFNYLLRSYNNDDAFNEITTIKNSIFIIQPINNNPQGYTLNKDFIKKMNNICIDNNNVLLFDIAYFGFDNFDKELELMNQILNLTCKYYLCFTFSKNMALFSQRIGFIAYINDNIFTQKIKYHIRTTYSSPSCSGSNIVKNILDNHINEWKLELNQKINQLKNTRMQILDKISNIICEEHYLKLKNQKGIYLNLYFLNDQQIEQLLKSGIYITSNGRINITNLIQKSNFEYFIKNLISVF